MIKSFGINPILCCTGLVFALSSTSMADVTKVNPQQFDFNGNYTVQVLDVYPDLEVELIPLLRPYVAEDGYLGAMVDSGKIVISDSPNKVQFIRAVLSQKTKKDYREMVARGDLESWLAGQFGQKTQTFELCVPSIGLIPIIRPLTGSSLNATYYDDNSITLSGSAFYLDQFKQFTQDLFGCETGT